VQSPDLSITTTASAESESQNTGPFFADTESIADSQTTSKVDYEFEEDQSIKETFEEGITGLFVRSILQGDIVQVRSTLAHGVDLLKADTNFLTLAVRRRRFNVAELLLENGVEVNRVRDWSCSFAGVNSNKRKPRIEKVTALHLELLLAYESIDMTKLLLSHGADPNAKTSLSRWTPLHIAAWHDHIPQAKLLLDAGAALEAVTADGLTPLHYAVCYDNDEMIRLLIERGAKIEAKIPSIRSICDLYSPLHLAGVHDSPLAAKILLEAGADAWARAKDGYTPLDAAMEFRFSKLNPSRVAPLLPPETRTGHSRRLTTAFVATASDMVLRRKTLPREVDS
jgi:hypothetical protein